MTSKQKANIKFAIKQKYLKGEYTLSEYEDLVDQLLNMAASGASQEDAKAALGLTQKKPKEPQTYSKLYDWIVDKAGDELDFDDASKLVDMVHSLDSKNIAPNSAKKMLDAAVSHIKSGKTADEAIQAAQTPVVNNAGANAADQAVTKLEKELKQVYGQAAKELHAKFDKFSDEYTVKMQKKLMDLKAGKITQAEYDAWVKNQVAHAELMQEQIAQMTDTMLAANQKAMGMVNGETLGVFSENANFQAYQLSKDLKQNLSFAVYDEETVKKLVMQKPELIPRKEVNGVKDKAWNQQKIAAAITQGILQGESIPKLAKRIANDTASDNGNAMMRYARTAMTSAQNSGRMETLRRAKDLGIKCKKCWLATLDSRTRDSHQAMDGVTIDIDEKFKTPLGSEMEYPGDMSGKPGDVWNCRCTMVYEYEGFETDPETDQRIQYDDYYTTYKDKEGKTHKVYHRSGSSLITNMTYPEWKASKQGGMMNDLNVAKINLAVAQKAVIKAKINENKVYNDIWKDPVTLADYPAKAGSISAKRDYYDAEIDKLKDAIANGYGWASPDKLKEFEKKRKLLNEFEKNGQLIQKRNEALKAVQDIYTKVGYGQAAAMPTVAKPKKKATTGAKKATVSSGGASAGAAGSWASASATAGQTGQFAPDAWDAATKKAAKFFDRRTETDKVLRTDLDKTWVNLTDEEKFAAWLYTWNSHPMNQPLSGYNDGWSRSCFAGGPDKTDWGHQDNYSNRNLRYFGEMKRFADSRGQPSYKKAITDLTNAIEKSTMKQNIWFKRQSDNSGLAGMLEATGFDFNKLKKLLDGSPTQAELDNAFVGQKGKMNSFTSCGMAKDAHWMGNVYYKIYVPKGTKAIYTEPQSHFGMSMGGRDKIYQPGSSYTGVGTEAEVVIQRGTTYRITGIRRSGSDYHVEMEVVEQPDYFRYGDEDTYNDGQTRHKK